MRDLLLLQRINDIIVSLSIEICSDRILNAKDLTLLRCAADRDDKR